MPMVMPMDPMLRALDRGAPSIVGLSKEWVFLSSDITEELS